jgi:hypothetical protein
MDKKYVFIENLGSSKLWIDNDKLIFITFVQRGLIGFLTINTKYNTE